MSLHDDIITEPAGFLFDPNEHAEQIDYTSNGQTVNILALCDIGTTSGTKRNPKEMDRSYGDAVFTVLETDVPKPHAGDTILYNNKKYTFVVVESYMSGMYDIRFVSNESALSGRITGR